MNIWEYKQVKEPCSLDVKHMSPKPKDDIRVSQLDTFGPLLKLITYSKGLLNTIDTDKLDEATLVTCWWRVTTSVERSNKVTNWTSQAWHLYSNNTNTYAYIYIYIPQPIPATPSMLSSFMQPRPHKCDNVKQFAGSSTCRSKDKLPSPSLPFLASQVSVPINIASWWSCDCHHNDHHHYNHHHNPHRIH